MTPAEVLESLVSIPSPSAQEGAIAQWITAFLQERGIAARRSGNNLWFEVRGGGRALPGPRVGEHEGRAPTSASLRAGSCASSCSVGRRGSEATGRPPLVHDRNGGPRLLLNSHLDTVPPCKGWESDPFQPKWRAERLYGLGSNDAKGCVAAMLCAAMALAEAGPFGGTAVFAFTAEEETGGQGISTILELLGPLDAAVVGEPTNLQACGAQRGMLILKCVAHGQSAHVAHANLADNAIHKAARDISKLAAMSFPDHPLLGATRAQVTQASGGLARNQVPDSCEFFVDLRTTPNLDHQALAKELASQLESEVLIHSARYLPKATAADQPILKAALKANGNKGPVGSHTTSDWAFLGDIPTVKIGPGDTHRSHQPNEYLTRSELDAGVDCYLNLILAYFEEAAKAQANSAEACHAR